MTSGKPNLKVIGINDEIPSGWRLLDENEAINYLDLINEEISNYSDWYIYALMYGKKLDGPGYGNKIHDNYGDECGQKLIGEIDIILQNESGDASLVPLVLK